MNRLKELGPKRLTRIVNEEIPGLCHENIFLYDGSAFSEEEFRQVLGVIRREGIIRRAINDLSRNGKREAFYRVDCLGAIKPVVFRVSRSNGPTGSGYTGNFYVSNGNREPSLQLAIDNMYLLRID